MPDYENIKIRSDDYASAKGTSEIWPIAIVDIISAWRHLWESATEEQQIDAMLRVRKKTVETRKSRKTPPPVPVVAASS